jgi:hypothetical protein
LSRESQSEEGRSLPFELASGNKGDKELDTNINLECYQTFIIHLYAVVNFIKDLFDDSLGFCEHTLQLSYFLLAETSSEPWHSRYQRKVIAIPALK